MKLPIFFTLAIVLAFGAVFTGLYLDQTSWEHQCAKRPWLDMSRGC
jgi:hypothetical protein